MVGFPTGVHNHRGVAQLVKMYFGEKIGMADTRYKLGCNNRKYYEYKNSVGATLDAIGQRADAEAHIALDDAGLLE
jgi:hypothetical protein